MAAFLTRATRFQSSGMTEGALYMKWPLITEESLAEFFRQEAGKGKWSFLWRIGILGCGFVMVCALNFWFDRLRTYPRITILLPSPLFGLPAGATVGLGLYHDAQKTEVKRRDSCNSWLWRKNSGEAGFVWRYGVLRFGVPMFFFLTVLCTLAFGFRHPGLIFFNLVVCLIGGAIFGLIFWSRFERKYR